MLGPAITTELQLLEARRHAAELAAAFGSPSVQDSAGGRPVRIDLAPPVLEEPEDRGALARPAAA
jgi:hypothetical protein